MNTTLKPVLSAVSLTLILNACFPADSNDIPNPYLRGEGAWGTLPEGRNWGAASAVHYAGKKGNQRCTSSVLKVNC